MKYLISYDNIREYDINESMQQARKVLKQNHIPEDDPDFVYLKDRMRKQLGNLGAITSFRYNDNVPIDELEDILGWVEKHKNRLSKKLGSLVQYKHYNDLVDTIERLENYAVIDNILDTGGSNYKRAYKGFSKSEKEEWDEMILTTYDKFENMTPFKALLNSRSNIKSSKDLMRYTKNSLGHGEEYTTAEWVRTTYKRKRDMKLGSDIVYDDGKKIMIYLCEDYKVGSYLGVGSDWCWILNPDKYIDSYINPNVGAHTFLLFDLDKPVSDDYSLIGITYKNDEFVGFDRMNVGLDDSDVTRYLDTDFGVYPAKKIINFVKSYKVDFNVKWNQQEHLKFTVESFIRLAKNDFAFTPISKNSFENLCGLFLSNTFEDNDLKTADKYMEYLESLRKYSMYDTKCKDIFDFTYAVLRLDFGSMDIRYSDIKLKDLTIDNSRNDVFSGEQDFLNFMPKSSKFLGEIQISDEEDINGMPGYIEKLYFEGDPEYLIDNLPKSTEVGTIVYEDVDSFDQLKNTPGKNIIVNNYWGENLNDMPKNLIKIKAGIYLTSFDGIYKLPNKCEITIGTEDTELFNDWLDDNQMTIGNIKSKYNIDIIFDNYVDSLK